MNCYDFVFILWEWVLNYQRGLANLLHHMLRKGCPVARYYF